MYHDDTVDDDDDNDDDDDVAGCLPHGSPVPGPGQPRPAAAARPHVLPRNLPPLPGATLSHSDIWLRFRILTYESRTS